MVSTVRNSLSLLCLLGCILLTSSCKFTRYYLPVEVYAPQANDKYKVLQDGMNRYVILRQQQQFYGLTDIRIDSANSCLNATVTRVAPEHYNYILVKKENFSPSTPETENEFHIYASDTTEYSYGQTIQIPLSHIEKIELIVFDSQKTKTRKTNQIIIGSVVGGVVGLLVATAISLAAIASI